MTKTLGLYRMIARGKPTGWISADLGDEGFVTYIQPTGAFQYHHPLQTDFYFTQEWDYQPISPEEALAAIKAGAGKIDGRRHADFIRELKEDHQRWTIEEVIPEAKARAATPQAQAAARARSFQQRPRRMIWRTYPRNERGLADALASKLRNGLNRRLGKVAARIETTDSGYDVVIEPDTTKSAAQRKGTIGNKKIQQRRRAEAQPAAAKFAGAKGRSSSRSSTAS